MHPRREQSGVSVVWFGAILGGFNFTVSLTVSLTVGSMGDAAPAS
jgi:hypothetical protein